MPEGVFISTRVILRCFKWSRGIILKALSLSKGKYLVVYVAVVGSECIQPL